MFMNGWMRYESQGRGKLKGGGEEQSFYMDVSASVNMNGVLSEFLM